MVADDELLWELEYPIGTRTREPIGHHTIRDATAGAAKLFLIAGEQRVFFVDLRPDWRPVFYRRRHWDLGGGAALDATVFGRVRPSEDLAEAGANHQQRQFAGQLFMARDGQIVECPPEHIDGTMIALQAMGA